MEEGSEGTNMQKLCYRENSGLALAEHSSSINIKLKFCCGLFSIVSIIPLTFVFNSHSFSTSSFLILYVFLAHITSEVLHFYYIQLSFMLHLNYPTYSHVA